MAKHDDPPSPDPNGRDTTPEGLDERDVWKLAGRMLRATGSLEREVVALSAEVFRLHAVIGRAPNDATGQEGSGLQGQVAELVQERRASRGQVMRAGAAGAAGASALIQLVLELFRVLGL